MEITIASLARENEELKATLRELISCFMLTDEWGDGTPCYEKAVDDYFRDRVIRKAAALLEKRP